MTSAQPVAPRTAPNAHRMQTSRRPLFRGLVATGALALMAAGLGTSAMAAPGATSSDTTEAKVIVQSAISLSGLPDNFTLTGVPGAVVDSAAVGYTVKTNNLAGYVVKVTSGTETLVASTVGNGDSIPIGSLLIGVGTPVTTLTPLNAVAGVQLQTKATRSAEAGDNFSNTFQITIPFVNEDTYTATLTYLATTL